MTPATLEPRHADGRGEAAPRIMGPNSTTFFAHERPDSGTPASRLRNRANRPSDAIPIGRQSRVSAGHCVLTARLENRYLM